MKINNLEGPKGSVVNDISGSQRVKSPPIEKQSSVGRTESSGSADVTISEKARLMKSAFDTAKASPDVRADRVNWLKQKIKDGTYRVDADAVAEKLISDHLNTDFGKNNL